MTILMDKSSNKSRRRLNRDKLTHSSSDKAFFLFEIRIQWFLKFPAIFSNAIFVKMAGNSSYFAKKKLHQKFFVQFNFELVELVLLKIEANYLQI